MHCGKKNKLPCCLFTYNEVYQGFIQPSIHPSNFSFKGIPLPFPLHFTPSAMYSTWHQIIIIKKWLFTTYDYILLICLVAMWHFSKFALILHRQSLLQKGLMLKCNVYISGLDCMIVLILYFAVFLARNNVHAAWGKKEFEWKINCVCSPRVK